MNFGQDHGNPLLAVHRRAHITSTASIGDPPPRAMIVSGSKAR